VFFSEEYIWQKLGYVPAITLEQGLRKLVEYYPDGHQQPQDKAE
jgi:hypothetical protein